MAGKKAAEIKGKPAESFVGKTVVWEFGTSRSPNKGKVLVVVPRGQNARGVMYDKGLHDEARKLDAYECNDMCDRLIIAVSREHKRTHESLPPKIMAVPFKVGRFRVTK